MNRRQNNREGYPSRVSVIVPVYNGGEPFRRCLKSLNGLDPKPRECIIISDGGDDNSAEAAERQGLKVIRLPAPPRGPAQARNIGTNQAIGEILFFVDADVVLPEDSISRINSVFDSYPHVAAVFGSYDENPGETDFFSQYKNLTHHFVHQTADPEASTFWAGCGAVRREIFMATGGFDEAYHRPSIEDIELGSRIKKAGYRIRLEKRLVAKHLKRWTPYSIIRSDIFDRALPWMALSRREGRMPDTLNLKISARASVICLYAAGLGLALGGIRPWLAAAALPPALAVLAFNRDLYRFYRRKRGIGFALRAAACHGFYLFYCGLAFIFGRLGAGSTRRRHARKSGHPGVTTAVE
ncbi:MAG: glycosyltransferase family 2 protein [Desulfobacterales bacterium]|nr:glycosyltransferase family 2 protein [Desulfobacterales bacterium]